MSEDYKILNKKEKEKYLKKSKNGKKYIWNWFTTYKKIFIFELHIFKKWKIKRICALLKWLNNWIIRKNKEIN